MRILLVVFCWSKLHYQKPPVCRVGNTLTCAKTRAHGKPHLLPCASRKGTRQLTGTWQIFSLPCVRTKKHMAKSQRTAKVSFCRVLPNKAHGKGLAHGKKALFAVCLGYYTRQSFGTRWNYEKKSRFCTPNFFVLYIYSVLYSVFKFGIFLVIFYILSHLISLIDILGLNWKCFE